MNYKSAFLIVIFLFSMILVKSSQANETATILIDENFLKESLNTNPPTMAQIEATFLNAKNQEGQVDDKFNTTLSGSASYYETKEKQFAQFIPVTSPTTNTELKVSRTFTSGVTVGLRGFTEQFSNNFVQDASTTGLGVQLSVDLWKELLSGKSQNQIKQLQLNTEMAKWQKEIGTKTFLNNLRKVYWSIVANNEALKISEGLLKSSLTQVKEAQRRLKNNIADKGEVARYQSQVASRNASIISLKYEKASLFKQLKELLPDIALNHLELSPYNIDQTVLKVIECSDKISSEALPPLKNTKFDEIVALLDQQQSLEEKNISLYDDIDVNLQTEVGYKGRSNSGSDATSDLADDGRRNLAVGLTFSLPIESKKRTTQEILAKAAKQRYRSLKERELAKVKAFHSETVNQVSLLRQIIRNQKENTQFLSVSLKNSQQKFNQARLTVEQLVQEQDAYLQSNLDEIRTKLTVINTIFDYLSIYTDTPCALNQL